MGKYEVSLATTYVKHWTVADAIRELLQNAIDAQTQDPINHPMSWEYTPPSSANSANSDDPGTLTISTRGAYLDTSTLLLGASSKQDDSSTIGQFGEGYKVASLVLLRNGLQMRILNGMRGEEWTPRMVKSRRYKTDVLTFFTGGAPKRDELTFEVTGLTQEQFDSCRHVYTEFMQAAGLSLQPIPQCTCELGTVCLTPEGQKSAVYVGGLFVCHHAPYEYSYNFEPGHLNLDRDRKLASSFDLEWLASKMWLSMCTRQEARDIVLELIQQEAADVKFIHSVYFGASLSIVQELSLEAWENFKKQYGEDAIPVFTQAELERISKSGKYKAILVPQMYRDLLNRTLDWDELDLELEGTTSELLERWAEKVNLVELVDIELSNEFWRLLEEVKALER